MKFWCIMLLDKDWLPRYFFCHAKNSKQAVQTYRNTGGIEGCNIIKVYEVKQE